MDTVRRPLWYRLFWWLPGLATALALLLAAATFRPAEEQSLLLTLAILGALPWSLLLLAFDFGPGFAARAALLVSAGLCVNAALLWWIAALLRAHFGPGAAGRRRGEFEGWGD